MTLDQLELINTISGFLFVLTPIFYVIFLPPWGEMGKRYSKYGYILFIITIISSGVCYYTAIKLSPKPKLIKTIKYYNNNTIDTTYYAN